MLSDTMVLCPFVVYSSVLLQNTAITDQRISAIASTQEQNRTLMQDGFQSIFHLFGQHLQATHNPTTPPMPQYDHPYHRPMPVVPLPSHATGQYSSGNSQQNHSAPSASASVQDAEVPNGRQYSTRMVYEEQTDMDAHTQTRRLQVSVQQTGSQTARSLSSQPMAPWTRDSGISEGTVPGDQSFEDERNASVPLSDVISTGTPPVHQGPEHHQFPAVANLDVQPQYGRQAIQHLSSGNLGHLTDQDQEAFQDFPPEHSSSTYSDMRNLQKHAEKLASEDDCWTANVVESETEGVQQQSTAVGNSDYEQGAYQPRPFEMEEGSLDATEGDTPPVSKAGSCIQ